MKICVINGVNLNKVGFRVPEVYGNESMDEIKAELTAKFPLVKFEFLTSNIEGEVVEFVQRAVAVEDEKKDVVYEEVDSGDGVIALTESIITPVWQEEEEQTDGMIINAGGYSHYSVAIRDAVSDIRQYIPVVEVHMTNIFAREIFRRNSVISPVCNGVISGLGKNSYMLGVSALIELIKEKKEAELRAGMQEEQQDDPIIEE